MKKIRNFFNMVEISLAMAVVAVGVVTVLGVIPVALKSYKEATNDNVVGNVSNFMRVWIDAGFANAADYNTFLNQYPTAKPDDTLPIAWGTTPQNSGATFPLMIYNVPGSDGLFRIDQCSGTAATPTVDSSVIVQVWREQLTEMNCYNPASRAMTIYSPLPYAYGVRINVQISYPADASRENRTVRTYKYDYYSK